MGQGEGKRGVRTGRGEGTRGVGIVRGIIQKREGLICRGMGWGWVGDGLGLGQHGPTRKSSFSFDAFLANNLDGKVLVSCLVGAVPHNTIRAITKGLLQHVVVQLLVFLRRGGLVL